MNPPTTDILPEGYKITELGPLPEEWEVVRVLDYCNFDRGTEPGSESYNREGEGVIFIRVGNISAGLQELLYTKSDNIKLCNEEDILMSFDGSPGIVTKGFKGAYSSGIRKVTPKTLNLDKNFLFYILKTKFVQDVIEKYKTGITIKHASKSIQHIKIPLPPLPEQQKIAAVFTAVQEAKEKTQAVIDATKVLKKSMMKHLFTYGPVPTEEAANVPLKETEIGKVPEEWEVVKLGEIFDIQQGKQLSAKESKEGKIKKPFLRTSNLNWGHIDISSVDEMYFTLEELKKLKLESGDILVCEGGDIGRTALYRGELAECAYQNHLHRLRPKKNNVDVECFVFWMNHAINQKKMYTHSANRTTIPNLSSSRLKEFIFPLPPLPIQQKIASILSAIDAKIEAEENKKQALEDLFKTLLYNLMTAKIRVTAINELP